MRDRGGAVLVGPVGAGQDDGGPGCRRAPRRAVRLGDRDRVRSRRPVRRGARPDRGARRRQDGGGAAGCPRVGGRRPAADRRRRASARPPVRDAGVPAGGQRCGAADRRRRPRRGCAGLDHGAAARQRAAADRAQPAGRGPQTAGRLGAGVRRAASRRRPRGAGVSGGRRPDAVGRPVRRWRATTRCGRPRPPMRSPSSTTWRGRPIRSTPTRFARRCPTRICTRDGQRCTKGCRPGRRAMSSTGCGWPCWHWTATTRSRFPTWWPPRPTRCGSAICH